MVRGRSGIKLVSRFDASACASHVAAEILDFRAEDFVSKRELTAYARFAHLGIAAAREAWEDAAPSNIDRERVGVCIGTAVGAIDRTVTDGVTFFEHGLSRVHPMFPLQYPGTLPSQVAIELGLHGLAVPTSSACTAGADAIGLAMLQIQSGMVDGVLAGASDAPLFPLLFASFDRLGALSRLNDDPLTSSRPFSADRAGFVMGEGAGVLMLEAEDVARGRGARIYAEIAGFGATCDAFHHLAPEGSGAQGARAVALALAHAGLAPADIDYVNAHGTSTPKNDATETAILKIALGSRAKEIPVSSSKSMLGHLIGASAPVELIVAVLALRHRIVPPTINFTTPDPECDLDYVTEGARHDATLRAVLSTSFGFGSRNAALIVRAAA